MRAYERIQFLEKLQEQNQLKLEKEERKSRKKANRTRLDPMKSEKHPQNISSFSKELKETQWNGPSDFFGVKDSPKTAQDGQNEKEDRGKLLKKKKPKGDSTLDETKGTKEMEEVPKSILNEILSDFDGSPVLTKNNSSVFSQNSKDSKKTGSSFMFKATKLTSLKSKEHSKSIQSDRTRNIRQKMFEIEKKIESFQKQTQSKLWRLLKHISFENKVLWVIWNLKVVEGC